MRNVPRKGRSVEIDTATIPDKRENSKVRCCKHRRLHCFYSFLSGNAKVLKRMKRTGRFCTRGYENLAELLPLSGRKSTYHMRLAPGKTCHGCDHALQTRQEARSSEKELEAHSPRNLNFTCPELFRPTARGRGARKPFHKTKLIENNRRKARRVFPYLRDESAGLPALDRNISADFRRKEYLYGKAPSHYKAPSRPRPHKK